MATTRFEPGGAALHGLEHLGHPADVDALDELVATEDLPLHRRAS
ncbi:MAG: hypothetical protein M5U28_12335 [Sandaracinaceae bacterium]|nr:hypothetical protein [Sandaracinaceae bacterium]